MISQASLYIHEIWPDSILLTDQLQDLILISLKKIMGSSKTVKWIIPFKKYLYTIKRYAICVQEVE